MRNEDGTFTEPIWGNKDGVVTCYMEKLVFDYELGGDSMGSKVYPSPESTYRHEGDGLIEVEIKLKRVIEEMDHSQKSSSVPVRQALAEEKKRNEDPEWIEYQRLRLKFDREWAFHMRRREQSRRVD